MTFLSFFFLSVFSIFSGSATFSGFSRLPIIFSVDFDFFSFLIFFSGKTSYFYSSGCFFLAFFSFLDNFGSESFSFKAFSSANFLFYSFFLAFCALFFKFIFFCFSRNWCFTSCSSWAVLIASFDFSPFANFFNLATKKPSILWTWG